jgi:hypothetical protein
MASRVTVRNCMSDEGVPNDPHHHGLVRHHPHFGTRHAGKPLSSRPCGELRRTPVRKDGDSTLFESVPLHTYAYDALDHIAAARAVMSGDATSIPKSAGGNVECVRLLRVARRSAMHARTQAVNQFHRIVDTAPDDLRAELSPLRGHARYEKAARFHTPPLMSPRAAAKIALCAITRRWIALHTEMDALDQNLRLLFVRPRQL